jgi:hypothetical protein
MTIQEFSALSKINYFEELNKLKEEYPELTFNNDGYQEIPAAIKEANADGINKIEELLKVAVFGFVRFQNFKPRKDGTFAIRCQTMWGPSFRGVSYFPMENFQPDHPSWEDSETLDKA